MIARQKTEPPAAARLLATGDVSRFPAKNSYPARRGSTTDAACQPKTRLSNKV